MISLTLDGRLRYGVTLGFFARRPLYGSSSGMTFVCTRRTYLACPSAVHSALRYAQSTFSGAVNSHKGTGLFATFCLGLVSIPAMLTRVRMSRLQYVSDICSYSMVLTRICPMTFSTAFVTR